VQSEEDLAHTTDPAIDKVLALFDGIFHPRNVRVLSSGALVEFARLHVSENCAQEAMLILQQQQQRSGIINTEKKYITDLTFAIREPNRGRDDSYEIDVGGARKFLEGYLSDNFTSDDGRSVHDRVLLQPSVQALETKLAEMQITMPEIEATVVSIVDMCLGKGPADSSARSVRYV
jgi:hypothetical protein